MKDKGKEKLGAPPKQKLRRRSPTDGEAWKRGPYKAEFDRKQTFALKISPKEKRPSNTGMCLLLLLLLLLLLFLFSPCARFVFTSSPATQALFGLIVKKGFSKLYNNQEISEVTLVLGGERIPTHKTVLCVWSDTLRCVQWEAAEEKGKRGFISSFSSSSLPRHEQGNARRHIILARE